MEAFRHLDAVAVPLPQPNIDTDRIIPARFLSRPREVDHGQFLFHDARLAAGRHAEPGLPAEPAGMADGADRRRRPQLRLRLARAKARSGRCSMPASAAPSPPASATSSGVTAPRTACCRSCCRPRRSRSIIAQLEAEPGAARRGRPAPADRDRARWHGASLRDRSLRQALPAGGPRRFRPDRDLSRRRSPPSNAATGGRIAR